MTENKKNQEIISSIITEMIKVIKDLSLLENKSQSIFIKLNFINLILRLYLKSINLLLENYYSLNEKGNFLSIGLLMRCCIEDMLYSNYLLSFREHPEVIEKEIHVQSYVFLKEYIQFVYENEHEFWAITEEEKKEGLINLGKAFSDYKKMNPIFFEASGELKKIGKIRGNVADISDVLKANSTNPKSHYERLKEVKSNLRYIYFIYNFFCQFEHYSFESSSFILLNDETFRHLTEGVQLILLSCIEIFDYIQVDENFTERLKNLNKKFVTLS
jgi:hypothetical protein